MSNPPKGARRNPDVSIVIPTYQEGKYIAATLSKLEKTIGSTSFEVIVVDGGSTDNTVKKAELFTEKVFKLQRGISKARNFGARQAEGKTLLFLDADVNLQSNAVEKILEVFKDSRVVGATCNILPVKTDVDKRVFFHFYNGLIRLVCLIRPHSRGEFLAVKKEAFFAVNGFDENLPCLEDHDLAYRLSKIGKFLFIKDLTVYESMRRFVKLGFSEVISTWLVDYLFYVVKGKPLSTMWKPVR